MTNQNPFAPATKRRSFARLAYLGEPGAGKTFSAIKAMCLLLNGVEAPENGGAILPRRDDGMAHIAVIDTERGSARLYSDIFIDLMGGSAYDVLELDRNEQGAVDPQAFLDAIAAARQFGYTALVIDSLSHAWEGILDFKDRLDKSKAAANRNGKTDSFGNWREVSPLHNRLVDAMLDYPGHIAACMRVKDIYEREIGSVKKVGTDAIQRAGVKYEFTVVLSMVANVAMIEKTRCHELTKLADKDPGAFVKPGVKFCQTLLNWLEAGEIAPMTRAQFITAIVDLGIPENEIGRWLQQHGILTLPSYEARLAAAKELLADEVKKAS